MTDRLHNIFGGFDWERLKEDFDDFHRRAADAELRATISDKACPCCGFRPTIEINPAKERRTKQPKQSPGGNDAGR